MSCWLSWQHCRGPQLGGLRMLPRCGGPPEIWSLEDVIWISRRQGALSVGQGAWSYLGRCLDQVL